jgi:hypothetical protein
MKRWFILSLVICLAVMGTAVGSVQMGDTELNVTGGYITENAGNWGGVDFKSWMVGAGLGYFTTDNIELAAVGLFKESTEKWQALSAGLPNIKRDANVYAIGGQVKYHFMPENQLVPYIGGQALWADVKVTEKFSTVPGLNWDRDKQGILWGPIAGLRYTLNEQNDVFVEYQYHIWSANIRDIMEDGHAISLGLSHKFK